MARVLNALVLAFSFNLHAAVDCLSPLIDLQSFQSHKEQGTYRFAIEQGPAAVSVNDSLPFSEYLKATKDLIAQRNPRATQPCPIVTEMAKALGYHNPIVADLVAPFELLHEQNSKAALLIHGLTDSPFTYHDLAYSLYQQGFNVRTLLLPGHATAASDLTEVNYQQWIDHVDYGISRTSKDFQQIVVVGYSTGAALALSSLAKSQPDNLKALALISPATEPHNKQGWAAKWIDFIPFINWIDEDADVDFAKYESFPWHGATLAHQAMAPLQKLQKLPTVPTFIAFSDVDATIDNSATQAMLANWQNQQPKTKPPLTKLIYSEAHKPAWSNGTDYRKVKRSNIIDMSHIGLLQSPTHPYYGKEGHYRNCTSYHLDNDKYQACRFSKAVYFGERHKLNMSQYFPLARLTFNPDYVYFSQALDAFFTAATSP
ncbi:alpha/beta hydrolase [Pseudoalteromonas sp. T1lg65]|uniref:alpha/beta hydrolase n=1 Tax=Pseudoalteromonas sp. T1lg65 TaxID=2077101 RepID=UPI003F79B600